MRLVLPPAKAEASIPNARLFLADRIVGFHAAVAADDAAIDLGGAALLAAFHRRRLEDEVDAGLRRHGLLAQEHHRHRLALRAREHFVEPRPHMLLAEAFEALGGALAEAFVALFRPCFALDFARDLVLRRGGAGSETRDQSQAKA